MSISAIPLSERPREKAVLQGIESLSNAELIAVIVGFGSKNLSILDLSNKILCECGGLNGLQNCTLQELIRIKGVKISKAICLLSVIEISKRMNEMTFEKKRKLNSCLEVVNYFRLKLVSKEQENFIIVYLDVKNQLLSYKVLFIGSIEGVIIQPKAIFREVIKIGASKIICVHNHPSGDPLPSEGDIFVTKELMKQASFLGIIVLDHIIIAKNGYFSMKEHQIID